MGIEDWWPKLRPETRNWLIEHNGEEVPSSVLSEITAVAGADSGDESWIGEKWPSGVLLSDAAVDWIEEVANDENPS
jgi:hypothetical protein